jgi:transcriptional regulator with AAA-type ATPase domain
LYVSGIQTLNLNRYANGSVGVTIDRDLLTEEREAEVKARGGRMATNGNAQLPVAEPWVVFKKLAAVFPLLQEAHYTFITRAAEGHYSRKRSRNTDPHAPELLRFLRTYLSRQDIPGPADIQPPSREVAALLAMARRTRNILLYGPPGTGKTWTAQEFAKHFLGGEGAAFEGRKRFVTFHQSFAYEEFVEGLKPETGAGESGIR